jgi:hypothetical protein
MANPLIDQGTLNRIRGSIIIPNFPELNVIAPYLGEDGISLALEGDAATVIPSMTGTVPSPAAYQMVLCTANLLKSNSLANQYKQQMEFDVLLGDILVRGDSAVLDDFLIYNVVIQGVGELRFAGRDAGFGVRLRGYYLVNSSMWDV